MAGKQQQIATAGAGEKSFALYARTSTDDNQSPADSLAWQRDVAQQLLSGVSGRIVEVFHDVDVSRSTVWRQRPQASALLAALRSPSRAWDAVVVAEPQRAFQGGEFANVLPILTEFDTELWVPEVGGAIDPDCDHHEMVMLLFGGMSKAERNRVRTRVRAAMRTQASQGRWLGGRPPYGYELRDGGPHPNPEKARNGARQRFLEINPEQADVVREIFELYIDGAGLRTIASHLTRREVPSPSASDPARNTHRSGSEWSGSAIRAILQNPTYKGERAFGRTTKKERLIDPDRPELGVRMKQIAADQAASVGSCPAIVTPEQFAAAGARNPSRPKVRQRRAAPGKYQLAGLVRCGHCGRAMEGRSDRRASGEVHVLYRCRPRTNTTLVDHPRTLAVSEKRINASLDEAFQQAVSGPYRETWVNEILQRQPGSGGTKELERSIEALRQRQLRLVESVALGTFEASEIAPVAEQLRRELEEQRSELRSRSTAAPVLTRAEVEASLDGLRDILDGEPSARAALLRAAGHQVVFSKTDGDSSLHLHATLQVANGGVGGGT